MAEWQPPRAIVIPIPALLQNPVNLETFNRLEDAIELATYFVQESEGDKLLAQQKAHVLDKVSNALPFMNTQFINILVDYLHPIFVAKAEAAILFSGHSVAQRLSDPDDSFCLGSSYSETARINRATTLVQYADDIVLF
jgi:hypothetical protein